MAKASKQTPTKAPKKAAKKSAPKAAPKKAAKKSAGSNSGLQAPLTLSDELSAVVGKKSMPRTEVIKKIWDYVKANNLQDAKNRRMINADDKLKPIFGKDQISMFELAKVINNHVKQ